MPPHNASAAKLFLRRAQPATRTIPTARRRRRRTPRGRRQTETHGRCQNTKVGPGGVNQIDRSHAGQRVDQRTGAPVGHQKARCSTRERQHQPFGEELPHDHPARSESQARQQNSENRCAKRQQTSEKRDKLMAKQHQKLSGRGSRRSPSLTPRR
jgi:hypothetical protein